jgi:hypothetical protein
MIRSWNIKSVRILIFFLSAMLLALAAQAASPAQSSPADGSDLANRPPKVITVTGTVERMVIHQPGGPPGFHLFIMTDGKTVDANLGPFLSKQNQEALVAGQLVQIVGVRTSLHGNDVVLARQLIFGGRLVTVRNERGALVREHPARRTGVQRKPTVNGGAQ